jgi:hypothetical protein
MDEGVTEALAPNLMDREEALEWKACVGAAARELRLLLWEGYQARAWLALGYQTWTACLEAIADEYGLSERHLWRLHTANQTEVSLTHGSVGTIPERQLRPLSRVTAEERPEVWARVVETAPHGRTTAAHVESVVSRQHPPTPEVVIPPSTDREATRGELFRCFDLLDGPIEWALLHELWRVLWDAKRDNTRLERALRRIRALHMPEVAPRDADMPEAILDGESPP